MDVLKKGDLVFLPSDAMLVQFSKGVNSVEDWVRTEEPSHVLLVEDQLKEALCATYCKIFYKGKTWYALKREVYPLAGGSNDS